MNTHRAAKDFSKATIKSLTSKGVSIIGSTWLPGEDGSFSNGERGYVLLDGETQRVRTYLQVVELGR
jgi:hypothetical protein